MARYAIYFLPGGALGAAGASWLGRDCRTGVTVAFPALPGLLHAEQQTGTAAARRYGFHATLKAPMHLAESVSADDLLEAASSFASNRKPVALCALSPRRLGKFLALVPDRTDEQLQRFAFDVVRFFDPCRAPLDDQEFTRRTNGLPEALVENIRRWGYPYVDDAFRFHITLTASVDVTDQPRWLAAAREWFSGALAEPVVLDTISVVVEEDPPGDFRELSRLTLDT